MFSNIPGLYPLGASSPRHHPAVMTPNLSRHCQVSPERQSHPIEKHRGREARNSSPRTPSALVCALMCESYTKHKHESYILHFLFQPLPQAKPQEHPSPRGVSIWLIAGQFTRLGKDKASSRQQMAQKSFPGLCGCRFLLCVLS